MKTLDPYPTVSDAIGCLFMTVLVCVLLAGGVALIAALIGLFIGVGVNVLRWVTG